MATVKLVKHEEKPEARGGTPGKGFDAG